LGQDEDAGSVVDAADADVCRRPLTRRVMDPAWSTLTALAEIPR
jgi:hypothetical protein